MVVCAVIPRLRAAATGGILIVLVALRPGGYLPAMYVIQALPFFALCVAGLVQMPVRVIALSGRKVLRTLGVAATAAAVGVVMLGLVPRWFDSSRQRLDRLVQ